MKNDLYEEFLRKVKLHNDWCESAGKIGLLLELEYEDLAGIKLNKMRLDSAVLYKVILNNADLQETDLFGCYLVASSFNGANLSSCNLSKSILDYASLINTNLANTEACKASFYKAILINANLSCADLRSASFLEANLEGATLRGADLEMASFKKARLYKADIRGAVGIEKTFKAILKNRERLRADGIDTSEHEEWIDVGPEGSPVILRGEEMRNWLLKATISAE